MNGQEDRNDQVKLLLEEWKQNVALYIDQDKRGFARIQMFLAINGALLVAFGYSKELAVRIIVALVAICITFITQRMYRRAHTFIHLRRVQGSIIERKLWELMGLSGGEFNTSSGAVTTFTRELAVFAEVGRKNLEIERPVDRIVRRIYHFLTNMRRSGEDGKKRRERDKFIEGHKGLIDEVEGTLGWHAARPFFHTKMPSLGHLRWLEYMFYGLHILWWALVVFVVVDRWVLN